MNKILFLILTATILLSACTSEGNIKLYGTTTENAHTNSTATPVTSMDFFAQCLGDNGATMYGAYWCPHCMEQKKLFGTSVQFIHYVECESEKSTCRDAKIRGYPTWIINGTFLEGERSLQELASLTGCTLPS